MATPQHKAFCVLQYGRTESVIAVQRAFLRRFGIDPPMPKSIRRWYRQFEETGCLCKGKSTGRPRTSEENVRRIQESFLRNPNKSTRHASRELAIPHTTVWRLLKRRDYRQEAEGKEEEVAPIKDKETATKDSEEPEENGKANGEANGVAEEEAKGQPVEEEPATEEDASKEGQVAEEKENEPETNGEEPEAPAAPAKGRRGRKPKKVSVEHCKS
nr:cilia- and flagella-associated protein 251-like isoform X1 [Cherax quadricarinatus]